MKRVLTMVVMLMFILAACGDDSIDEILDDNQDVLDNEVTIIFDSNGGSEIDNLVVSLDNLPTALEEPTREGYTFGGWYLDEAFVEAFDINAIDELETVTVYAQWTDESDDTDDDDDDDTPIDNEVTIIFDSNGGSTIEDLVVSLTDIPTSLPEPSRDGYQFLGWYLDDAFTEAVDLDDINTLETVTVYARWVEVFEVRFNVDGNVVDTQTLVDGETITAVTDPTKVGHTFDGWYKDAQFTESLSFDASDPVDADTELYAKFIPNTYTITFDAGEYTVDPVTFEYGTQVTLPEVDDVQGFLGWYLEDTFETLVDETALPADDLTVYGLFMPMITIGYYVDETLVEEQTVLAGEGIVFPENEPTKTGHTFIGWRQFEEGFTFEYVMNEGAMVFIDTTLEAVFEVNEYTISFDDANLSPITLEYGETIEVEDYEDPYFIGWYLDDALTDAFDYETMPAYDITLYADVADPNEVLSLDTVLANELASARIEASVIHYEYYDLAEIHVYILNDGNAQLFVALESALTENVDGKIIDAVVDVDYSDGAFGFDVGSVTVLGDVVTPLDTTAITVDELAMLDFTDLTTQATIYTIEGFVMAEDGGAVLFDPSNDAFYPIVNMISSTAYDSLLTNLTHSYVSFAFTVMDDSDEPYLIYLDDVHPMTSVTLTDAEKLTLLSDLLASMGDIEYYMVGETFDFPDTDPFFGSTMTSQIVGDNAHLYDAVNDEFLYTESDVAIDVEITLTLGSETTTVNTTVTLEGVTIDSYDQLESDGYYTLEGTVFYSNDTHLLFGDGNTLLWLLTVDTPSYTVGNTYTLEIFTNTDGMFLTGDVLTVFADGGVSQDTLTPTPLTIAALEQISDMHSALYHTFEGVILSSDNSDYPYILSDGVRHIYLPDDIDIENALGEKVTIDLFITEFLSTQDDAGYIGYYNSDINAINVLQFDLLDQLNFAEQLIQSYLQNVYRPNKTYTFPLNFDDLGFPVTYTLIGGDANNVTMVENGDQELTFTEAGIYNIDISISAGSLNGQLNESFIVEDYTISSINDALNDTPGSVHTFELRVDGFSREHDTILTDGTDTVLVSEDIFTTYYSLGQTLIVTGALVQVNGVYYIDNAVLEEETAATIPLTQPQVVTFADLQNMNEPYGDILHIEIEGVIDFPPTGSDMALIDTDGSFYLLGRDPSDGTWFNHLGETVLLRGYFMYSEDFGVNIIAISEVTVLAN